MRIRRRKGEKGGRREVGKEGRTVVVVGVDAVEEVWRVG